MKLRRRREHPSIAPASPEYASRLTRDDWRCTAPLLHVRRRHIRAALQFWVPVMTKILVLETSLLSATVSSSRLVTDKFVQTWVERDPAAQVVRRDLAEEPIPHITFDALSAAVASARAGQDSSADAELSSTLIDELRAADVLVIGVPMYNFSIPSSLKCWIDHVAIAGKTFRYTAEGRPEGLLHSKRAFVIASRGGIYESGPMVALNYQDTYLRVFLGFIGIRDVTVIAAERQNMGPAEKSEGLKVAYEQVDMAIQNSLDRVTQ